MSAMPIKVRNASRSVMLITVVAVLSLFSPIMYAAVVIDIVESDGDVVATTTGSINTAGLIKVEDGEFPETLVGIIYGSSFNLDLDFDASAIIVGSATSIDVFRGVDETQFIFSTGSLFEASSGSGDLIGIVSASIPLNFDLTGTFALDATYVSGGPLSATSRWTNQTITSMGLIPGSYVLTWGSGATADSLTVNIDSVTPPPPPAALTTPIPTLSQWALVLLTLLLGLLVFSNRGRLFR